MDNRLKELRQEKGLSQADVADAIGVSRLTYGRWESDLSKTTGKDLFNLAIFFKVSIDDLFFKQPRVTLEDFGFALSIKDMISRLSNKDKTILERMTIFKLPGSEISVFESYLHLFEMGLSGKTKTDDQVDSIRFRLIKCMISMFEVLDEMEINEEDENGTNQ